MGIFVKIGTNDVLHIAWAWSRLTAYWPALKKLGSVLSVAISVPGAVYSLYQVTQIKDDATDAKRKLAQAEELVTLSAKRLEEARRLSDAATDQAKFTMRLVESAERQLSLTREALEASRVDSEARRKAQVIVLGANEYKINKERKLEFSLYLANIGGSYPQNLSHWQQVRIQNSDEPIPDPPRCTDELHSSIGNIGNGIVSTVDISPRTKEEIQNISRGTKDIISYGSFCYGDGLGNIRSTKYCYVLSKNALCRSGNSVE